MKTEDGDVKLEYGVEVGQKRPFPATADDDEDAGHRWKLRGRTGAVGLGELYDPGVMKLKPRVKAQPADADGEAPRTIGGDAAGWTGASGENRPKATEAPRWTTMKWRKPGEAPESEASVIEEIASTSPPITDEAVAEANVPAATHATDDADVAIKKEDADVNPGSSLVAAVGHEPPPALFKKRKLHVRN